MRAPLFTSLIKPESVVYLFWKRAGFEVNWRNFCGPLPCSEMSREEIWRVLATFRVIGLGLGDPLSVWYLAFIATIQFDLVDAEF